jgi:hypothetical protein
MTILSLKLNIDKNKWSMNLPMSGKNEVHKRHVKTPPKGKTNYPLKTSRGEQKPFINLNDHLEYNANTNVAT